MIQVSLDTSFLISFADPTRANHMVAVEYFRHFVTQNIPMWISVVAAGEFEVKQPIADLPLQNFRIQPYNLMHAVRAAKFFKALLPDKGVFVEDKRPIILNDLKILAQASEEEIPVVLTEDKNTLFRKSERLRGCNISAVKVLLLSEGFTPNRLSDSPQSEIEF